MRFYKHSSEDSFHLHHFSMTEGERDISHSKQSSKCNTFAESLTMECIVLRTSSCEQINLFIHARKELGIIQVDNALCMCTRWGMRLGSVLLT